ncbi:hypothetical protein CR513_21045, partial [Mucuna pruriens]
MYLVVSKHVISVIVVQELGKKANSPICISKVLQKAKTQYQIIEKLVVALVTSARCLRPYFHLHTIVVRIDHPIRENDYMIDRTIQVFFEVCIKRGN